MANLALPAESIGKFLQLCVSPESVKRCYIGSSPSEILGILEDRYGDYITAIAGFYRDGRGRLCWTVPRGCALYGYRSKTNFITGFFASRFTRSINSGFSSAKFGGPKASRLEDSTRLYLKPACSHYPRPHSAEISQIRRGLHSRMSSPFRKQISPAEIVEKQGEMTSQQKALAKDGNGNGHRVLPPEINSRFDDVATAERFLEIFGEELQFLAESNKWLKWDGKRWSADTNDSVFELATIFAGDLYSPEKAVSKETLAYAQRANSRTGLNAFLESPLVRKRSRISEFDAQPYLINCVNGTLDLGPGHCGLTIGTTFSPRSSMPSMTRTPSAISSTSFSRPSSRTRSSAHSCSDRSATRFSVPSAKEASGSFTVPATTASRSF
jgi:hypothetical protein